MIEILRKIFNIDAKERKYNSYLDEFHRYCDGGYLIKLNVGYKLAYKLIVETSLQEFNISNLSYLNLNAGKKIISHQRNAKATHYEITKYELNKIYEISTKINKIQYWTSFEIITYKKGQTTIQFSQRVKNNQIIDKIFDGWDKFKFQKGIVQKGKFLQDKFLCEIKIKNLSGKEIEDKKCL